MKLKTAHVREFRSIWDSNPVQIADITCLVGKNEAGKTALLRALYRLNPILPSDDEFDVTDDYPRSAVEDYNQDVETRKREHATVIEATFQLDDDDLRAIADEFGEKALIKPEATLSKGYAKNNEGHCARTFSVRVNEPEVVKHLVAKFGLPEDVNDSASQQRTVAGLAKHLAELGTRQEQAFANAQAKANAIADPAQKEVALSESQSLAESGQAKALRARLAALQNNDVAAYVWNNILRARVPHFLYFDEYYQMRGHDNVQALKQRQAANKLEPSDHPLLGLLSLARLDIDKLLNAQRTQELKNNLQGASNHLSKQILKYWSQNRHLRMNFDIRTALPADPEGMRQGMNIWGEVYDQKHLVSTGLGTRSRGFVWFFSFLAWYSSVKKSNEPLVLLLDEPALSLHGKAQEDLLRYFEAEIASNPKHQLVYTTHSPFMVDSRRFDRVRIVQDKSIDTDDELPREQDGTKVFTDVLEAGADTLFPLQSALGYEIYQSLFIGPNSLLVEGASDLLYLQTISGLLQTSGREGLDPRWTITPVGGADKVPTFVALAGAQNGLNIAVLIDYQKSHAQLLENLYKKKLLKKNHVLTFADFTGKTEADIEDMFDEELYLQLVNGEFAGQLSAKLKVKDLTSHAPRILVRLEELFASKPLKASAAFSHYRPARYFAEKVTTLTVPPATLERFEAAFKAVNALLR